MQRRVCALVRTCDRAGAAHANIELRMDSAATASNMLAELLRDKPKLHFNARDEARCAAIWKRSAPAVVLFVCLFALSHSVGRLVSWTVCLFVCSFVRFLSPLLRVGLFVHTPRATRPERTLWRHGKLCGQPPPARLGPCVFCLSALRCALSAPLDSVLFFA